jgi:3-oxoadipate enol-lactonase
MTAISIGSAVLNYERSGEAGPWLVLLHEIGGTLESWALAVPALAQTFTVVRYDQRGTGKSDRIRGPFSIETQVDDLAALLDALGAPARVHLGAVAIGAAIAVRFAATQAHRVASLVLACPAPGVDAARIAYLDARAAKVEREGMSATVEDTLANSYPEAMRRDPAAFAAYRERFLANDPASYAAINRAFSRFDAVPDLKAIRCPTLVLAGRHDRLRPPDFVRKVASRIPGASCVEIDSGHVMPMQAPAALVKEMLGFYRRLGIG